MIDNMVGRLASHSMFAEPGAIERLKMCADCRVVDMLQNAKHGSIPRYQMTVDALHNEDRDTTLIGVTPEDRARAEVYALLGSLFYQSPSVELLSAIATTRAICNDDHIDVQGTEFCKAWRALQQAAADADAEAVKDEFDTAFIGTGRQPVMLYGSYYLAGFLNEKPLAQLRDELTKMGLARREDSHETEDHISALVRCHAVSDRGRSRRAAGCA